MVSEDHNQQHGSNLVFKKKQQFKLKSFDENLSIEFGLTHQFEE